MKKKELFLNIPTASWALVNLQPPQQKNFTEGNLGQKLALSNLRSIVPKPLRVRKKQD